MMAAGAQVLRLLILAIAVISSAFGLKIAPLDAVDCSCCSEHLD